MLVTNHYTFEDTLPESLCCTLKFTDTHVCNKNYPVIDGISKLQCKMIDANSCRHTHIPEMLIVSTIYVMCSYSMLITTELKLYVVNTNGTYYICFRGQ